MKILLLTPWDGEPTEFTGTFVVEYDPSFRPPSGEYQGGLLRTTRDPAKARDFRDLRELTEYWHQSYGLREDGEPLLRALLLPRQRRRLGCPPRAPSERP